ncbi:hypothetical protein [Streptomyces sp. NPDC002159]
MAVEQAQKPMSLVITAGQRGDSPQFQVVLGRIRVPRPGPGRPRTRPDKVRADKAYGSRANRAGGLVDHDEYSYEEPPNFPKGSVVMPLISGLPVPPGAVTPPPRSCELQGEQSCRPGGRAPHCGADQQGNGGTGAIAVQRCCVPLQASRCGAR